MSCALSLALASAGKSIAARIAMIAMTTSNSIKVKAPPKAKSVGLEEDLRIVDAQQEHPGLRDFHASRLASFVSSEIVVFGNCIGFGSLNLYLIVTISLAVFCCCFHANFSFFQIA